MTHPVHGTDAASFPKYLARRLPYFFVPWSLILASIILGVLAIASTLVTIGPGPTLALCALVCGIAGAGLDQLMHWARDRRSAA